MNEEPLSDAQIDPAAAATGEPAMKHGKMLRMGLALATLILVAGAGGFELVLQKQVNRLQQQLRQQRAAAEKMAGQMQESARADAAKIERLQTQISTLEVSVGKMRASSESLQKNISQEIKNIAELENRLPAQSKDLIAQQEELIRQVQTSQENLESRFSTVVTVLRNQDKVLRKLAGESKPAQ